jgi:chorismate mutase
MKRCKNRTERDEIEADLALLESLRWSKKELFDRICQESKSQDEKVLSVLRLEPAYQFAEFYYLLRARRIETEDDIQRLADIHNKYIVDLTKDPKKMARLGLNSERLLDAMFAADTMRRLAQIWRDRPGTLDQSNLARLLVLVMSTETCRKVAVACAKAGFLQREESPYGMMLVCSNGVLEQVFGGCIRDLRHRIHKGG